MIALLSLLGCLSPALDSLPAEPRVVYAHQHARWTQDLQILRQLETQVLIEATLVSEELAEAQALTLSRARMEDEQSYRARKAEMLSAARATWTLVLSSDAPAPRYADELSLDESADWTLRLEVDGEEAEPLDLERIEDPGPDERMLYPQASSRKKLWRVRFARSGEADKVTLYVTGPYGAGRLTWEPR